MKKLFKYTLLFAVGALVSCTDEYEYDGTGSWDATENYNNVSFVKASEEIELEPTAETKYEFQMTRTNTAAEAVVPFVIEENTEDVFSVGEVKFAAGDSVATGVVTFNSAEVGKPYTLKLSVSDPNFVSQYSQGIAYSLTINRVKWNPAGYFMMDGQRYDGYAAYTEDIVSGLFGVEDLTYPVMLQERDDMPGYFRMINAYGEGYPYNAEGDYNPNVDSYIFIDATNPEAVYIPARAYQETDWGYGKFIIFSLAGYYLERGNAETAAAYFGTYKNGVISFPVGSLLFGMTNYNDGGLYASNNDGNFKLVIDPSKNPYKASIETDFAWYAEYTGVFTSEQLKGTGSSTLYKGVCTAEKDNCDSVFAAEFGTPYYIEAPYADGCNLFFSVLDGKIKILEGYEIQATGLNAMGADVYAKINQGTSSFSETEIILNITFQNADGTIVYGTANESLSNITYSPVGIGAYTYNILPEEPATVDGFIMSKRDDKQNEYIIEQWMGPFGGEASLTFNWDQESGACIVPMQPTGLSVNYTDGPTALYVADAVQYAGAFGVTWSYEQYPCYFDAETSTFNFPLYYFVYDSATLGKGYETFKVEFDEVASGAKMMNNEIELGWNKSFKISTTPSFKTSLFGTGTKVNLKNVKAVNGPAF